MSEKIVTELPAEVEKCEMVVVYDCESGTIKHIHRVFTWRGGEHPSREELEREAMEQAAEAHMDLDDVELLHVDPRTVPINVLLSVDVKERVLVATPADEVRRPC